MAGTQGSQDVAGIPFAVRTANGAGKLALVEQDLFGWLHVDRLELDLPGGPEAGAPASRYQRRRTLVRIASLRVDQAAIDARVEAAAAALAGHGITGVAARATDGAIAISARVADGLASSDVSFRVVLTAAGLGVRALAGALRIHGHLPTPGPVLAHRVVEALVAAGPADGGVTVRGLCDFEFDALGAFLWRLLPPAGWRLPSVVGIELCAVRVGRGAIHLTYAPASQRAAARVLDPATQLAAAHDAMRSADELLRRGQLDEAMRGYRALVASAPADHQPILLERILAIGAARPTWFLDAVELARQALARWPGFAARAPRSPRSRSPRAIRARARSTCRRWRSSPPRMAMTMARRWPRSPRPGSCACSTPSARPPCTSRCSITAPATRRPRPRSPIGSPTSSAGRS